MALLEQPPFVHLVPFFFLIFFSVVAVPQLLVHILFHPQIYLVSPKPFPERLATARRKLFFYAWRLMSPMLDPGDEPIKAPLLKKAYGTVLEIGAGVGDNIKYYRRGKIERLVLVEPNTNMHPKLRAKAADSGFVESDGSLLLLGCGGAASDEKALALAGIGPDSVDTIASIHVLCGIPGPDTAVEMYRRLLKRGGLLLFFEHVRSEESETAQWQDWYTQQFWPHVFDGCCLNRPTGDWIIRGLDGDKGVGNGVTTGAGESLVDGVGKEKRWKDFQIKAPHNQPKYTCLPHVEGWAIKA